jgi:hypothetical protein
MFQKPYSTYALIAALAFLLGYLLHPEPKPATTHTTQTTVSVTPRQVAVTVPNIDAENIRGVALSTTERHRHGIKDTARAIKFVTVQIHDSTTVYVNCDDSTASIITNHSPIVTVLSDTVRIVTNTNKSVVVIHPIFELAAGAFNEQSFNGFGLNPMIQATASIRIGAIKLSVTPCVGLLIAPRVQYGLSYIFFEK